MERRSTPSLGGTRPRAASLIIVAALVLLAWSCTSPKTGGAKLDYSTTRLSATGAFKATFLSLADPIPLGQVHSWRLHVADSKGQALTDATIAVDGGMPEHRHGLPTQPQVTQNLGSGDYLVEGLKFQMRGWWEVRFTISSGGTSDTVTFNLKL